MSNVINLMSSITTTYNRGKQIGFGLDLDGASVHRAPAIHTNITPETKLDDNLVCLVEAGQIAFINTGRPESFVQGLLPNLMSRVGKSPNVWISTENGACVRGHNGFLVTKSLKDVEGLKAIFANVANDYPGAVIEVGKNHSMTISVAKAKEKVAAFHDISERAENLAADYGYKVISGLTDTDGYIEFVNPEANKGSSTVLVLNEVDPNGKVVWYAHGDSKADEAMMTEIVARKGYAVGVGTRAPDNAQFYVDTHHQTQRAVALAAKLYGGQQLG